MNPILVALDVDSAARAIALADDLRGAVGGFKIGKQLFTAVGPSIVKALSDRGERVFLDLKFHDIPKTVAGAVAAAARHGVAIVNVHASGGIAMMTAAATAAREEGGDGAPLVLGVTVLTHLADGDLEAVGFREKSGDLVLRLARLAASSGLDGVVASALEVEAVRRELGDRFRILVPGVRPSWSKERHDQKRVATPGEAARLGASHVVVGRAIALDPAPRSAAERILEELSRA
jgi:orotidine-5'-phosphate decarboxylase